MAAAAGDDDGTNIVWTDTVWLSYEPLNRKTALGYFMGSPFYDAACNNELIRMQRLDAALLSTMDGVEYALMPHTADNLFLISKSRRVTGASASLTLLAVYYIANGHVYQAPSVHSVLSSRVLQAMHHLRVSFDTMESHARALPVAAPREPHWNPPPATAAAPPPGAARAVESDAGTLERRAIDRILNDVLHKNSTIKAAALADEAVKAEAESEAPHEQA